MNNTNNSTNISTQKRKQRENDSVPACKEQKKDENEFLNLLDQEKVKSIMQLNTNLQKVIVTKSRWFSSTQKELMPSCIIVGETSSAKSTLIQSIMKIKNALPTGRQACTMTPIKICIEKPNQKGNNSQFSITRKGKYPQEASSTVQVGKILDDIFAEKGGYPDYKDIVTLTVTDPDALQMVFIDTPGPRGAGDGPETLVLQVDGIDDPTIIITIRCSLDIYAGGLLRPVTEALKGKMQKRRIIIVITCIDDIFTKDIDQGSILEGIQKLSKHFPGADVDIALVQCIDFRNISKDFDHHRAEEKKTISKLSREIREFPKLKFGVMGLTDLLMREYLKSYNENSLGQLQSNLEMEITAKTNVLIEKKTKILPCQEATKISSNLGDSGLLQNTFEKNHLEKIFLKATKKLAEDVDYTSVSKQGLAGVFGLGKLEIDVQDLKKAKKNAITFMEGFKAYLPEIVKEFQQCYDAFLKKETGYYANTCPKMIDTISLEWTRFFNEQRDSIISYCQFDIERAMTFTDQTLAVPFHRNLIPQDSILMTEKRTVAVQMRSLLGLMIENLFINIMGIFNMKIVKAFPTVINQKLAPINTYWSAASDEEIALLELELNNLVESKEALKNVLLTFSQA